MVNLNKDILLGTAIGDALGVPVEFEHRQELGKNPVVGMREYGTHNQPKGTWSDDTSLALCLAESLCTGHLTEKCLMLVLPRQEQYPICKVDVNQNWQEWIEKEITVTDHL